jgi:hypothetical protein
MALCGCLGGHPELAPASAGGNAWSELKTDHFRIVTDLKERDAVNVLAEYEHVYELLVSATHLSGAQGSLQAPSFETQAVVFRDYEELHPFVPAQMVGTYQPSLPNEIEGVPTILASGTLSPVHHGFWQKPMARSRTAARSDDCQARAGRAFATAAQRARDSCAARS